MKKRILTMCVASVALGSTLTACESDVLSTAIGILDLILTDDDTTISTTDGHYLGWLGNDEDTESIEDDIMVNAGVGSEVDKVTGLPTKVDLSVYLPKVGDQGSYGTCTAWATAYHARTWLTAYEKGVRGTSLSNSEISSAEDMFMAIDASAKGSQCAGSNMASALDVMVSRGVASVSKRGTFSNANECDCQPTSAANSDAKNFKIKNYREINIRDVNTVKRYLSEKNVVMFGAALGDNFMLCNSSSVITSNGTFKYTGQHAYHAILCVGYDDSKGPNGAFRIVNSWGDSWGDKGYCWVDTKFFCSEQFAYCGFVMNPVNDITENPDVNAGNDDNSASGTDLMAYKCSDTDYYVEGDADSDDPTWRTLVYDVYNGGDVAVPASATWATCYLLYNAYDAKEYQIVLCDLYTDQLGGIAKGETNDNWSPAEANQILGLQAEGFAVTNVDIPANSSVCETVYGKKGESFSWSYKLPNVTGKYYLVLMADAFGAITESNSNNNYYFLTGSDGGALDIKNGVIQTNIGNNKALKWQTVKPKKNTNFETQTAVNDARPNTYSPEEISYMIRAHKESGEIGNKALRWLDDNEVVVKKRTTVKY